MPNKSQQRVIDDIARCGWHCVHILAEGELVEYSFTVGLFQTFGHPELIIFGLPSKLAHQIISIAVDAAKSGRALNLNEPTDVLLKSYVCCFARVPVSEYFEHVGVCRGYYSGDDFPLYQIVWPSRLGLFPWHADAEPAFRASQPIIAIGAGGHQGACDATSA